MHMVERAIEFHAQPFAHGYATSSPYFVMRCGSKSKQKRVWKQALFPLRPSHCGAVHFFPAQECEQLVENKYKNTLPVSTAMHFEEVRRDLGK